MPKRAKTNSPGERNSPEYKRWRRQVVNRDGHTCQMPGCGSKKKIQVHHIQIWARFPELRFVISNGITLCESCHEKTEGKEEEFEELFHQLVRNKSDFAIQDLMDRYLN